MASPALASITPSPRVKLAAKLWLTGTARTKREASRMAGLHPNYLTMLTGPNGSVQLMQYINEMEARIEDGTVEMSQVLQELGRKAIVNMARLMESSGKDEVKLRAAVELAERSPETQKIMRAEVTSLTLSGEDAKELARAMIESRTQSEQFDHIASDGLIEVDTDDRGESPIPQLKLVKELPNAKG